MNNMHKYNLFSIDYKFSYENEHLGCLVITKVSISKGTRPNVIVNCKTHLLPSWTMIMVESTSIFRQTVYKYKYFFSVNS